MHPHDPSGGSQPPQYPSAAYPPAAYPTPPLLPHETAPQAGGIRSAAARKRERRAESGGGAKELIVDKFIDFALIFVGLYAATALQRCQDTAKEKQEYISLLKDFKRELQANLEQEGAIERDLGSIDETAPGKNLGPMQATFTHFFEELAEDEEIVHCLHEEFAVAKEGAAAHVPEGCHEHYKQFEKAHSSEHESFSFKPAVLTPFYRHEVWQLYLADGVKTFRNKELAVRIAEVYANARLIEEQVEDIELTYNDAFMVQVGRTAATDMEIAEIVHDEEQQHGLSEADMTLLLHVDEAIKDEHYASLEVERILELKVERMKKTVLLMRSEIDAVQSAIDRELGAMGAEATEAEE
jgi:hypothetical protein